MHAPETADPLAAPPGVAVQIGEGLRQIRAPNPSAMTGAGTNSYLVGQSALAVIDPGPDSEAHLAAILAALQPGQHISHILVTHGHLDHSALAPRLAAATGAVICGFGPATAGRSAVMQALAAAGLEDGGEGVDRGFAPGHLMADGQELAGPGWRLTAWHTPGHMGSHLGFALRDSFFSGDAVMGWSSSLISPPDGDMGAYMATLARLAAGRWGRFLPGHGAAIADPAARLAELTQHRRQREAEILAALRRSPASAPELARRIYTSTPAGLMPAATRNVLAHLVDLHARRRVSTPGLPDARAIFTLCDEG